MEIFREVLKTEYGELMEIRLIRFNGYFDFTIQRYSDIVFNAKFQDTKPDDPPIVNHSEKEINDKVKDVYRAAIELIRKVETK